MPGRHRRDGSAPARRAERTGRPATARPAAAEPAAPSTDAASAGEPGRGAALMIDALGRKCPIPIIWVAARIREIPIGQLIGVLADDPAAHSDIPAWCRMKSHDFVREDPLPAGGGAFLIRRCY